MGTLATSNLAGKVVEHALMERRGLVVGRIGIVQMPSRTTRHFSCCERSA